MTSVPALAMMRKLLLTCHQAKRIVELQPPLPPGYTPASLRVLDALKELSYKGSEVKVSDISQLLKVTRPGITRLAKELEAAGAIRKVADARDGRIVRLKLTAAGERFWELHINKYHRELAERLEGIAEADIEAMARVVARLLRAVNEISFAAAVSEDAACLASREEAQRDAGV